VRVEPVGSTTRGKGSRDTGDVPNTDRLARRLDLD
jgi:hypothetical protein